MDDQTRAVQKKLLEEELHTALQMAQQREGAGSSVSEALSEHILKLEIELGKLDLPISTERLG